jgi:hypothetical protein
MPSDRTFTNLTVNRERLEKLRDNYEANSLNNAKSFNTFMMESGELQYQRQRKQMISDKQNEDNTKMIYENLPEKCHHLFSDVLLYHVEDKLRMMRKREV